MVPLNSIELFPEAQSSAGHACWTERFERDFNAPQIWAASSHVYTHLPLILLENQWNPPLFRYVLMLYLHSYSKYLTCFCPAEYKIHTHTHKKPIISAILTFFLLYLFRIIKQAIKFLQSFHFFPPKRKSSSSRNCSDPCSTITDHTDHINIFQPP